MKTLQSEYLRIETAILISKYELLKMQDTVNYCEATGEISGYKESDFDEKIQELKHYQEELKSLENSNLPYFEDSGDN